MEKSVGITDATKNLCRILLEKEQTLPQDSLFRDDIFDKACRKMQDRNEARIVQDITRLIVPSAETLATYGATHLDPLIESVNEGWNSAIPFYGPRPQPDYSVGTINSKSLSLLLVRLQILLPPISWPPDVLPFPHLRSKVRCGGT